MMRLKLRLALPTLWFCLSPTLVAQAPNWYYSVKRVEPLKSTKIDVEKLFSAAQVRKELMTDGVHTIFYDDLAGKFTVEYSLGTCATVYEKGYVADRDVVLRIIYFPKIQPRFSRFKLDGKEFVKTKQGDDPGWHYISAALGFDLGVQLGRIDFVERVPSSHSPMSDCK